MWSACPVRLRTILPPPWCPLGSTAALSFTIEMLDRVRQAAQSARKIGVVEVLGEQAGWLALQAGIAARADVVLIPEIPCDLQKVATRLKEKIDAQAALRAGRGGRRGRHLSTTAMQRHRHPLSKLPSRRSRRVMRVNTSFSERATRPKLWRISYSLLIAEETYPLVMGPWVRGGVPTAVDRQLGMGYGLGRYGHCDAGQIRGDDGFRSARH